MFEILQCGRHHFLSLGQLLVPSKRHLDIYLEGIGWC